MNANQIISRLSRMVMRRLLNKGVTAGIDRVVGGKSQRADDQAEMTPQARRQSKEARQFARRAKQAARMVRRIGKF